MAKLKEKDKRPTHTFEPGDIVRLHQSVKNVNVPGEGIVLCTSSDWFDNPDVQCIFASREVDLWLAARSFALNRMTDQNYKPYGTTLIETSKLHYIRNERDWLKPPTSRDISNLRFSDLLDEMP